jgi:hypothetical protein
MTNGADLDSKERQLSSRIKKLNMMAVSLTKKKTKDINSVLGGLELDKQDKEQVDKLALANGTNIMISGKQDITSVLIEDYALAAKDVATMRSKERLLLNTKVKRATAHPAAEQRGMFAPSHNMREALS